MINTSSKVAVYKINSLKSIVFLHTDEKSREKDVRQATPCSIASNHIKYLEVNLTQQVKNLYDKFFKSLKKKFEEDIRKG